MDTAGASTSTPAVAPRSFGPPTIKPSDSGVALGLFSKIAAARKEKLSPFVNAPVYPTNGDGEAPRERRASTPVASSQFPEIHDASGRTHVRASALNPPLKRGGSTRGLGQLPRGTPPYTPPPITTPIFPIARGVHGRTTTTERTRRSLYEVGKGTIFPNDRILPHEELRTRPSTAGDEPAFGHVRGYARRSLDGGANNIDLSQRRTHPHKPNTADAAARRASSPLALRGQPEVLVLDSPMKTPLDPVVNEVLEQEIYFAETTEMPGVPVVYRHQKAKATNPERLNLDRRNLPMLPLLEGEQMLRLLNLQNNVIRRIEHLAGLPNLIFLDLYNNRIERLENLHVVPNLRVLMLGKNRLQRIENLDSLKKLDVLDLHSNELERMENLNELTELRVLNLGGNRIKSLEGIDKLHLLTELNLRRNSIATISSTIGRLPSLQRLFLSNNKLDTLEALEPLFQINSTVELRLDNNGACEVNPVEYRSLMIKRFPLLKHLDLRPLTDAERKDALLYSSQARAASKEREDLEDAQRDQTIAHIRSLWEKRQRIARSSGLSRSGSSTTIGQLTRRNSGNSRANDVWGRSRSTSIANGPPLISSDLNEDDDTKPTSREEATVYNTNAGYSEIEVHGEYRVLAIYGDALEILDNAKVHASIHAIKFRYVSIDRIKAVAASSTSANLKLFVRLRRLVFAHNDIDWFDQLSWLGSMGSRSEELFVTHNAVTTRSLFRNYVAARISNAASLNGKEIKTSERTLGRQLFPKKPSRLRPLETSTVQSTNSEISTPTRAKETRLHSARKGSAAAIVVNDIVVTAMEMDKKNALVEESWRAVLTAIATETIEEIASHEGNYMAGCLDGL